MSFIHFGITDSYNQESYNKLIWFSWFSKRRLEMAINTLTSMRTVAPQNKLEGGGSTDSMAETDLS